MTPTTIRIGKTSITFTNFEDASKRYRAFIEARDLGVRKAPHCLLLDANANVVGHVSYNGRVWEGDPMSWVPGKVPVYDPNA